MPISNTIVIPSSGTMMCQIWFTTTECVLYAVGDLIMALVIIIGNSITILTILRDKSLRTPTNLLLASLAVSDLLVGLALPYHALGFTPLVQNHKQTCLAKFMVLTLACMASILHLGAIAFDRFLAIGCSLRYSQMVGQKSILITIVLIWVYAICYALLPVFWNSYDDNEPCTLAGVIPWQIVVALGCQAVFVMAIMMLLHCYIFVQAEKHSRQIRSATPCASPGPSSIRQLCSNFSTTNGGRGSLLVVEEENRDIALIVELTNDHNHADHHLNTVVEIQKEGSATFLTPNGGFKSWDDNAETEFKIPLSNTVSSPADYLLSSPESHGSNPPGCNMSSVSLPTLVSEKSHVVEQDFERHYGIFERRDSYLKENGIQKASSTCELNVTTVETGTSPFHIHITSPKHEDNIPASTSAQEVIQEEQQPSKVKNRFILSSLFRGRKNKHLLSREGQLVCSDKGHRLSEQSSILGKRLPRCRLLQLHVIESRSIRIIGMILGCFLISWMPFWILTGLQVIDYASTRDMISLYNMFAFLALGNSCMNPIIYAWKNRELKQAFKETLSCSKKKNSIDFPASGISNMASRMSQDRSSDTNRYF